MRHPLTDYKKRVLRKAAKDWGHVLRRPKDFDFRKVSKETAEKLKGAGFQLFKNRAVIPTRGQKVNIRRGTVFIRTRGRTEKVLLANGAGLIDRLKSYIEAHRNAPQKLHTYYGMKLGAEFFNATGNTFTPSLEELHDNLLNPKYLNKESLMNNIAIVEVEFFDDDDDPDSWESNLPG